LLIDPTSEQLMLRDATRAFLDSRVPLAKVRDLSGEPAGFDRDLWEEGAAMGWLGMLLPEDIGGSGLGTAGVIETAIIAEEMGRMLHPGPFIPVNVVADAVSRLGSSAQKEAILPSLVSGSSVATWAIADGPGCWDGEDVTCTATRRGGHFVLRGVKRWVQDAESADHLLVTCREGSTLVQLLVPAHTPGVAVLPLTTLDLGRRLADVEFDDARISEEALLGICDDTETAIIRQLRHAVVLQCVETVGAAARVLEGAVEYARQRVAFGQPIGAFQAVKHLLARAATWLEAAQAAAWDAVAAFASDRADADRSAHVAKAFVAVHCPRIIEDCMQVYGGIAMTWEHDSHLYLRRARSNAFLYGGPAWHAERVFRIVGRDRQLAHSSTSKEWS
jgi:alkylation response protein AidB-like acyl-CoA dehydrogenase